MWKRFGAGVALSIARMLDHEDPLPMQTTEQVPDVGGRGKGRTSKGGVFCERHAQQRPLLK